MDDIAPDLRRALGQFATGVTIVTTAGTDMEPVGITANSFSSVSLEPPLVLWSLADDALSRNAFVSAGHFCVHVLGVNQLPLSEKFACRGNAKFRDIEWIRGIAGVPLLDEYVARFQCRTVSHNRVGDHTVFVGEVMEYEITGERPLVFHAGEYALAERRMLADVALRVGESYPKRRNSDS